ncbi:hydrogenase maturation protease [Burkholderiales bacterium GJ-E10]|nr:hydrogenase maturation protease [Burkholderiales bacterium GJ-E10]
MTRTLIAGIGNPDRGDDGVGPAVIAALADRLPDGTRAIPLRGDLLPLLDAWSRFERIVLVDACANRGAPGRIHRLHNPVAEELPSAAPTSSHALGVAETLALARALAEPAAAAPDVVVYAVEGACFDFGAPLSPPVAAAIEPLVKQIAADAAAIGPPSTEPAGPATPGVPPAPPPSRR